MKQKIIIILKIENNDGSADCWSELSLVNEIHLRFGLKKSKLWLLFGALSLHFGISNGNSYCHS